MHAPHPQRFGQGADVRRRAACPALLAAHVFLSMKQIKINETWILRKVKAIEG
jgi:hypothetical protein